VLTFDNASKSELQSRLQALVGVEVAPRTLNSFGFDLLKRAIWAKGDARNPADKRQQRDLCSKALRSLRKQSDELIGLLPEKLTAQAYLELFSFLKNRIYSVREPWHGDDASLGRLIDVLNPILPWLRAPVFGRVDGDAIGEQQLLIALRVLYEDYCALLDQSGYIDFDDQKLMAYEHLRDNKALRDRVQSEYREVIVDEFQDLNLLDFELIRLVAEKASLVVVGDDDQAIYEFRGASPEFILDFEGKTGRPTETHVLRTNYRSPGNLVWHASKLIAHNSRRVEKHPTAARAGDKCDIRVHVAPDVAAEAFYLAKWIRRTHEAGSHRWSEFAILYRMNRQSLILQVALTQQGVPYFCVREDSLLDTPYFQSILSILRWWVADHSAREIAKEDVLKLCMAFPKALAPAEKETLREVLANSDRLPAHDIFRLLELLPSGLGRRLEAERLAEVLRELRTIDKTDEILSLVRLRWTGLRETFDSVSELNDDWSQMDELLAVSQVVRSPHDFGKLLSQAAKQARTSDSLKQAEPRDAVTLATFFRAKGRQFRTVVLPSLVEGWVPLARNSLESERRLFYVAVTRATHDLVLSYAEHVMNRAARPSPFLGELQLPESAWPEGTQHSTGAAKS
jgi:DNA helicase-2/ATP-dependent DNA helicase PcrA